MKALDRSQAAARRVERLSDHHVNIVACSTHTGSDRISRMRFDFEMADPSHLDAVLRTIKNIDAVYDAYRMVPGAKSRVQPPPATDRLGRRLAARRRAPEGGRQHRLH